MTISGLLFINTKGEVIVSRYYRDNVSRSAADAFRTQVIAAKKGAESVPIINIDKVSFLYCRQNDVYIVASGQRQRAAHLPGNGSRSTDSNAAQRLNASPL